MPRHLASRRSRVATRRLTRFVSNPPVGKDIVQFIGPGVGAYAGTRLLQRLAFVLVSKRFPKLGKHAGVFSSAIAFGALWFLAHRWKKLEKYHTPIVVGSGIAAVQGAVQTYLPQLGWVMSDVDPKQYQQKLLAPRTGDGRFQLPVPAELPEPVGPEELEDYIEVGDAPYAPQAAQPMATPGTNGGEEPGGGELDDLDPDELGSLGGADDMGILSAN